MCEHDDTTLYVDPETGLPFCRRCDECLAFMSLGPSNDSPPEVRMEIRAAEILEPEFDGEMYFVRWVPRQMYASENAAFSAAYRGEPGPGMPRRGAAGWLAWEIKSDVREDDHRREYAAAAAVRHLGLTRQQVAEHQAAADRIEDAIRYETQRAAEPDCRDEDDEPVECALADLSDGLIGDPDWQAKVWERIGRGTCAIDGCNEPIAEDALCAGHQPAVTEPACAILGCEEPIAESSAMRLCAGHQPGAVQAAIAHPDTLAAPPMPWPPNTGCDPEDAS